MACLDSEPKREFKSRALNKLNDILQGFVDSLSEEETSFDSVLNVVVKGDHKRELTYQLKIVENLVKSIREQVPDIQESLTVCDEIFSLACGNSASQEDDAMFADVGGEGASNANTESKEVVNDRRTHLRRGSNTCRHVCSHHQEVMDDTLWRKLPREVVQHVCAFLPFSKTLELQTLCEDWSRMPMATTFRQSCSEAHEDLFGMLISAADKKSYRIVMSNSKHTEWLRLELKDIPTPSDHFQWSDKDKEVFAHDGGLICILPNSFKCFGGWQEPPSIFVFNPLTGDKRDIPLSSFTSCKDTNDTEAVLLKLKVDSQTGCYELVLVTRSGEYGSGAEVYCSEIYDSKSKLWSTLDSGFVFGDGVINNSYGEVYFDCCSKQPVFNGRGQRSFEEEALVSTYGYCTFVKDHRFEIIFYEYIEDDREYSLLEVGESIWENGWNTTSFPGFSIEQLPYDFQTKILACQRYVLVVAGFGRTDVCDHGRQRLLLYDRETCEEVHDIPNFWKEFDGGDEYIFNRLHVMCDLKWNATP